ncbi:MAG: DUF86 domain-containing protein [Candidatus Aureabacteria bacterium]|nr:DUF86 domain-containing protein [Candidatus Auribacterota bacterium]
MIRNNQMFISDIVVSMNKIGDYTSGLTFESFKNNDMIIDAVVRNFQIIGEASKNLPEDIKAKYPLIPWKKMISLRNYIAHEYFGIDISIIWNIVTKNIPETKPLVIALLEQSSENEDL